MRELWVQVRIARSYIIRIGIIIERTKASVPWSADPPAVAYLQVVIVRQIIAKMACRKEIEIIFITCYIIH